MTPSDRRIWPHLSAAAAVAVLAIVLAPPAHAAPTLNYGCSPPAVPTPASCAAWHTQPVTLVWDWNNIAAKDVGGNCATQTFTKDTASLAVSCEVQDRNDKSSTEHTVFVHVDRTPPLVTSAIPDRPPDLSGWWNHPLSFTFAGTDATSGIASCTPVTFGGPGTSVTGSCTDKAGNVGSASFPVAYDATPPALLTVKALAGNRSATVEWQDSPDVVRVQVMRSPGPRTAVYNGAGRHFHDDSLRNGIAYRYTVTVFDQAGNSASAASAARPAVSLGLRPRRGTKVSRPPLLRWPAVKGASYYNLQLYKGKHRLLNTWPGRAALRLRRGLKPGRYRWYVWPGYGSRAAHHYGKFVGQSSFKLVR